MPEYTVSYKFAHENFNLTTKSDCEELIRFVSEHVSEQQSYGIEHIMEDKTSK